MLIARRCSLFVFFLACSAMLTGCAQREKHKQVMLLGKAHYQVAQYTENLPPVTKIEINVLQDAEAADPGLIDFDGYAKKPGPGLFPIWRYRRFDRILSTAVAHGEAATEIADLWRTLHFSKGFEAMCHYPVYGLRFYNESELVFETSLCWTCSNFSVPKVGFWGFDSRSRTATELLAKLQRHAPLPAKPSPTPRE